MSPYSPITIERVKVRSVTPDRVAESIKRGASCLVRGATGSGKSHAVREAVNGAVWVDVAPRPFTVPMFATALANQLGEETGRKILEACANGDTRESLQHAESALGDRVLVVDSAEHLAGSASSAFEDSESILLSETEDLMTWIRRRFESKPTVVVTSRLLQIDAAPLTHTLPSWHLKLTDSATGFYRWKEAADLLDNRPGGLQLAALSARLVDADRFNETIDDLQWAEKPTPASALSAFADLAVQAMSTTWRRALAVHAAIEGTSRELRDRVTSLSVDLETATRALTDLGLVDTERGFVHVNSALGHHSALARVEGASQVLREAARHLQDSINDSSALRPSDASAIFLAHRLFVRLGDFESAARTARLHRGGLIALARQVSLEGHWDEARRLYERVLTMLPEPSSQTKRRARSYVVHHRAYNGHRARTLPNSEVLRGYEDSTDLWSDNALWWKRRLCLLVELGRLDDFRAALAVADHEVPTHKRKDGMLRVPAAMKALEVGEALLSLELLEQADTTQDPVGDSLRSQIEAQWVHGIEVDRLEAGGFSIVLNRPTQLQVRRIRETTWQGKWLERSVTAAKPTDALRALVHDTCQHIRHLVETPTHLLDEREVFAKQRMIGDVDLGASELGLWSARERWLLGSRRENVFRPAQNELPPVELPPALRGVDAGLFFARVPVTTDGLPSGPVEELVSGGSGRSLDELLKALNSLRSAG